MDWNVILGLLVTAAVIAAGVVIFRSTPTPASRARTPAHRRRR